MSHLTLRSVLATIVAGTTLLAVAASLVLIWRIVDTGGRSDVDAITFGGLALGATYGAVGWLIATRQPRNAIGWVFLLIGASQGIDSFASLAAVQGLLVAPGSVPFATEWAWLASWGWAPGFTALVTYSLLLFPDGKLPSPRWRPVAWLAALTMLLLTLPPAAVTWTYRGLGLVNGTPDVAGDPLLDLGEQLQTIGILLIPVVAAASIASMVVHFRRSHGTERQQLKWFTYAAIPEIAFIVASGFVTWPPLVGIAAAIFIAPLLPIAAAIAIQRYRLYDIDRIVSRTVAYTVVTGLLATIFVGSILLLQNVLQPFTKGGGTVAIAASTLAVFALFQPLRRRVQHAVDRRFDRARIDAERTTEAFAERLRADLDIDSVAEDLARTTSAAVAPTSLGIWIREPVTVPGREPGRVSAT